VQLKKELDVGTEHIRMSKRNAKGNPFGVVWNTP